MFKRAFRPHAGTPAADSQHRVDKSARLMKRNGGAGTGGSYTGSFARETSKLTRLQQSLSSQIGGDALMADGAAKPVAPSPIATLTVGREGRLFAAHEDVLCQSPFFEALCRRSPYPGGGAAAQSAGYNTSPDPSGINNSRRIVLPDEEPEIFSAVLEYLYKGDYYPRLLHSRQRNSWELEDANTPRHHREHRGGATTPAALSPDVAGSPYAGSAPASPPTTSRSSVEATVYLSSVGQYLLRDTVIYCAAVRYGLEELKRLALRKQGLQSGIDVGTILRSAQYCYAHTPDSDSRLRAHYLALIIRCRKTFKRSGTMQAEMEKGGEGGKLFFDLFVALCNHLDDVVDASNARTPRTI
ncbi:BTB/POZ fold protein [Niveomyces insectorum RCEF 264]|uniref:BTB/POZ fold protein n=1 Tax=Niveomyces insectorum RCEF 264 TaxID=1081102 RepID=A0A162KBF4_9HYPO|nr:BTB/POZ fold protein [Niveomyces insectorum RCEF 264]